MYLHLWQHCHRWGTASQSCPPWFCPLLGKWQAKHSHPFCLPLEKFSRADARGVVSTSEWGTVSSTQWVPVSGDLLRNKQFFSPLSVVMKVVKRSLFNQVRLLEERASERPR